MKIENVNSLGGIELFIGHMDLDWQEKKKFERNKLNELYLYREKIVEQYLFLNGEICINGVVYGAGTILTYEPFEIRNFFVIKDADCLCIRDPKLSKEDKLKKTELFLDSFIKPYYCESSKIRYNDIKYKDITVVLQGAIDKNFTNMAIESIRRFLPGAKIVISTWEDEDVSGLEYDELVLNEDPGAPSFVKVNGKKHIDNRNRLLVSTQEGIKQVTSKYTLKMRTDCILMGDGIVRNYGKYPKKLGELSIFQRKLVIGEQCNILNLNFEELSRPYLFHVSDWFAFGLTDDVKAYFLKTKIEPHEQIVRWKYKKEWNIPSDDLMGLSASPRYNSEQYYFVSALKRKYEIFYEDVSDYSKNAAIQSEKAIIDNFEILNIKDHEIINAKKQHKQAWNLENAKEADYLTNKKYEMLYKKYTFFKSKK